MRRATALVASCFVGCAAATAVAGETNTESLLAAFNEIIDPQLSGSAYVVRRDRFLADERAGPFLEQLAAQADDPVSKALAKSLLVRQRQAETVARIEERLALGISMYFE
ncbi:MAG: hypothetical protein ACYSU0_20190, partial [Planctomycetota bacterium]